MGSMAMLLINLRDSLVWVSRLAVKRMEYQISRGATAGSDVNERELTNQISCVVRSLSSFHRGDDCGTR